MTQNVFLVDIDSCSVKSEQAARNLLNDFEATKSSQTNVPKV
jgi:hypothetical protein